MTLSAQAAATEHTTRCFVHTMVDVVDDAHCAGEAWVTEGGRDERYYSAVEAAYDRLADRDVPCYCGVQ